MSAGTSEAVSTIKFVTGLRGYHVYRSDWKPFVKQPLSFKQEKDNKHDRFAVAGKALLPGTLFPSIVGHIPIELSRYIWHALERGADIRAEVKSAKYKPSPLVQGGLEIPIEVTVKWKDLKAIDILNKRVEEVSYPVGEDDHYIDESKDILKSLLLEEVSSESESEAD